MAKCQPAYSLQLLFCRFCREKQQSLMKFLEIQITIAVAVQTTENISIKYIERVISKKTIIPEDDVHHNVANPLFKLMPVDSTTGIFVSES